MNKHISLVKRYLAGDEVSIKELEDNFNAANVVAYAATDAASAVDADDTQAVYWVKKYESLVR